MARLAFFFLLVACAAFGAYVYLAETRTSGNVPREINPASLKVIAIGDASRSRLEANGAAGIADRLRGAACVEFSVKPANRSQVQTSLNDALADGRATARDVEGYSRYIVSLPAFDERKEAADVVAKLKKAGVTDLQIMSDNAVSLGAFSTEEAARRHYGELERRARSLVKDAVITPRGAVVKATLFTIREPDTTMVARLTVMQRTYEGSDLKALACPTTAPVTPPGKP